MPGLFDYFSSFLYKRVINQQQKTNQNIPFIQKRDLQTKSVAFLKTEQGYLIDTDIKLFKALGPSSHEVFILGPNLIGVLTGKLPNGKGISLKRDLDLNIDAFKNQKDPGISLHQLDLTILKTILSSSSFKKGYSTSSNHEIILNRLFEISDKITKGELIDFNISVNDFDTNVELPVNEFKYVDFFYSDLIKKENYISTDTVEKSDFFISNLKLESDKLDGNFKSITSTDLE